MQQSKRIWTVISVAVVFGVALSCATTQPPFEAISRAEVSVRKADDVQASQHAPLEVLKAREKLDRARVLSRSSDTYAESRRLAEQAMVDARLAEEKAQAARAEANTKEMRLSIETLRAEIARQEKM